MDRLLGITGTALRSVQCREGVYLREQTLRRAQTANL